MKKDCNCKGDKKEKKSPKRVKNKNRKSIFEFKIGERIGIRYEGKNYYGYIADYQVFDSPKLKKFIFFGPPKKEIIYTVRLDNGEFERIPQQRIFSIDKI